MPTIEEIKNYTPLIAILISIIALLISIFNAINTRKSLNLSIKQYQNKLTNFEIYLINSYSITIAGERYLLFHITLTNKAESKNSFQPTLILEYLDSENQLTKLQLPHVPEQMTSITKKKFSFFSKQIFTNEKESISKWLLFSYNLKSLENKIIDSYVISLKDTSGMTQMVRSKIIKELS